MNGPRENREVVVGVLMERSDLSGNGLPEERGEGSPRGRHSQSEVTPAFLSSLLLKIRSGKNFADKSHLFHSKTLYPHMHPRYGR